MKIYTKSGDGGETGLWGGVRIRKTSPRIVAIGDVDELNATLGAARCFSSGGPLEEPLQKLQCWLFDLGAELASPPGGKFAAEGSWESQCSYLEASMDEQVETLPPLKSFILPGGCPLASSLHLARAVCRRAERSVLELHASEPVGQGLRTFLNRLSDWLFVTGRTANRLESVEDIRWTQSED